MTPAEIKEAFEAQTRGLGKVIICSIEPTGFRDWKTHLRGFTQQYFDADPSRHWTTRGRTLYEIPPADPKTKFSILHVYDAYEMAHNPDRGMRGDDDPEPAKEQKWKLAAEIAQSLILKWGDRVTGQVGARGIGIIADEEPTQAERKALEELQGQYHDRLIQEADAFVAEGLNRNISDKHQNAARARGVVRVWQIQNGAMKVCPNCSEAIYVSALGCKSCGTSLMDWYENQYYSVEQVNFIDPAVAEAMRTREKNKAARSKPPIPTATKA